MKPLTTILALAGLTTLMSTSALAQSVGNYAPVTRTTGITYTSIVSTGNSISAWRSGTSTDNRSMPQPIGFTFYYDGQPYTQFSMGTDGYIDFSSSTATGSGTGAYGYQNTQFSAVGGTLNALAPLYEDLDVEVGGSVAANFKYLTTGSSGSRVLTVEWFDCRNYGATGSDINMQVKLYEGTGVIQFLYGTMTLGGTHTYTCGINGPTMSVTPLVSELLTQQTANSESFSNIPQNALATLPTSNSMLTLTPVQNVTPAAPTDLTFTSVTQTGMTVGWTDASTTETYFVVFRSTDGVNYSQVGTVTSTTIAGTGTIYSLVQSGLTPGVTYYFRITANNEASAPSAPLSGSQATLPPGEIASVQSGNWGDPATWSGGAVPTAFDNVTIADGHTVIINVAAVCWNLNVGQGVSGVLEFETAAARTLTAGGNVAVAAGGTFQTGAAGTVTTHALSVGGNLTNNGLLDFSTNANTAGAGITFTGAASATFAGTGATTDIRTLTVNKGTSAASVLTLSPSVFTVQGTTTDGAASAFLTLTNGMLRLAGTFAGTHRTFTSAAYTIGATTGFWLDNPNYTVAGQTGSPTLAGTLRVFQGTFNIGTASGNAMGFSAGASIRVEGGAINAAGRFCVASSSNAITYFQNGGTITVNTVGNTSTTLASFDLGTASTSNVTLAGGTIITQLRNTATSGPRDYRCNVGAMTLTGGTLQIGNALSGAAGTFYVQGYLPNVVITNTSAGHSMFLAGTTYALTTTVNPTTTLNLNGYRYITIGTTLTNNGTLTGTTTGSGLYFLGPATPGKAPGEEWVAGAVDIDELAEPVRLPASFEGPAGGPRFLQTYTGAGVVTAGLIALEIDNLTGVEIHASVPANIVTNRVNLFRGGSLVNSGKITLGNGGTTAGVTQYGAAGMTATGASYDAAPVYNAGSGGYIALYAQEGALRTTGFEIPPTRILTQITMNNTNHVTLAGGGVTLTTTFTLTAGRLNTSSANVLTIANSFASPPAGSAASHVNGPLGIEFNVSSATNRTFAIGKGGSFRPLILKSVNTGGVSQTYVAEVVNTPPAGTPQPPLMFLNPARYWTISNTANLNATARANLTFGTDDNVLALASARVAQSDLANGDYTSLGGVATGSPTSGTVESTLDLTPGNGFFTTALEEMPITWDGGAGTTFWGDAANWNPDGVPTGAQNVSLSAASATTIDVNGDFAASNLDLGANITLNILAGNTLTTNGAFAQGAGTVNLGTATLQVRGAFTRTAGTFNANTGTTLFSGTAAQAIGGGVTHYNLVFRNGGAGLAKVLTAGSAFTVSNDLTVESTAQLALSAATSTSMSVAGNLSYAGIGGGTNVGSLTLSLTGVGRTINGAALGAKPEGPVAGLPAPGDIQVVEISMRTDPNLLRVALSPEGEKIVDGYRNTYAQRAEEVEWILAAANPEARYVINLDDMTIVKNPAGFAQLLRLPPAFDLPVTVAATGSYSLGDHVSMAAGRTLTVSGRLDCQAFTIAGAGNLTVGSAGTLGTATLNPGGLGATVLTTGTNTYTDGSMIDYNAAGDQTINAASHPAASMIYTSGSGTKTLDASKTITGSSGSALTKGAIFVNAGTTLADGGNRITFTTGGYANIIVNGAYASSGPGSISYESGPYLSNIQAIDGTVFGDLLMNFTSSTNTIDMNAVGTVTVTFRNLICGGTAGTGTAGGTLKLSETGTTNIILSQNLNLAPLTTTNTGGGFNGNSAATTNLVRVLGDITSTSTASTQPIMGSTGTNTLVLNGSAAQTFTVAATTNMFTGATLKIDNAAGVTLGGAPARSYGIAGTLELAAGNVTTGVNTLAIRSTGSVVRTSGHVVGNLVRNFSATALARNFEIGSPTVYTPVAVAFASISTAGDLTAATFDGDHPSIGGSPLLAARNVNRYYRLTNQGIVFTTAGATFNWDPADLDPGADPSTFVAGKYDAPTWTLPAVGTRTPTSLQVTGVNSFSDFAMGNLPSFTLDDVAVVEGDAGTVAADFTVTLSDASTQVVTVQVATADGTATVADNDYVALPLTTLTFNPSDPLTQTVSVTVNGDTKYESDETFFVNLSNASNASIADSQGLGTIENDDLLPAIAITDVAVLEGDSSPKSAKMRAVATFTVSLSNPSKQVITIDYATADGTATVADDDYLAIATTTLTFNPGDPLSQGVAVTVIGDTKYEFDETFFVNLSNAVNATIADPQGQGTIENDDPEPSLTIDDVAVLEGNAGPTLATFTVTLSGPAQPVVSVDCGTADGTATAPGDYLPIAPPLTLTWNSGDPLSQTVAVTVNGDLLNEADETFFVNLTNATNATIADAQGEGTIQNDDPLPALAIDDVTVVEGDAGTTAATFTVTLSPASGRPVSVSYQTADGTATVADNDYLPVSPPLTLTFNPGDPLTQAVTVSVVGDLNFEPDESFFVNLSSPTNATIADAQGEGTIQNDDAPSGVIRVPEDYPTIQQAIDAANPLGGSTVQVAAGTYPENLLIDRQLVLTGAGSGQTFVNAASPGIVVAASAVTISNLTLTGTDTDRGILVDHGAGTINLLTVSNVEIRNFECGIWFEDAVPPLNGGIGHLVAGCQIHDIRLGNPLFLGAGINGSYTAALTVRGTAIHDNGGPGIYLRGATGAVLANAAGLGNYFYRNVGLALVLDQNPADVAASYNYWGHADPEAVIHHQVDDPPEGLVTFANAVAAMVFVDPVFQRRAFTTEFTADLKIDMQGIPQSVRQYNIVLTWDASRLDFVSAAAGPYLASGAGPNGTAFFHYGVDGQRTLSEAILGAAPGATGNGTLCTVTFTTETTAGISPLDLPLSIVLRDMSNPFNDIPNATADGSVEIDGTPPANVTAFTAAPGHNKIRLTWVDPTDADFLAGGGVEIWRAGWDKIAGPPTESAYPEYDDWPTDELPVIPATRAAAAGDPDWSVVTTVAPGIQGHVDASFTDSDRNVYFYAAFARDDVFNYAATVAAVTHDRATSYYLGDFTRGIGDPLFGPPYGAPGAGAVVDFNDLAAFSSVFATVDGGPGYNNQGDIGPSDDNSSFGIPLTDDVIDFEDLILFAINFSNVFPVQPAAPPVPADATGPVIVQVLAPPDPLPAGAPWVVRVRASGAGQPFLGLSVQLAYDPERLALETATGGDLWAGSPEGFLGFVRDAGRVSLDGAFLGAEAGRRGEVASLAFRTRVAGPPALEVARLVARSARNAALAVELGEVPATAVADPAPVPLAFALGQNEPNPFNPSTAIRFDLAADAHVELAVFDVRGRLVRVLVDERRAAGRHVAVWDGRDARGSGVASGVYVVRIVAGSFSDERKMTLVR